ncbi:MAG: hypothetical protein MJZ34_04910 [Paludibacteraceae bacterium]|nr:hypothetical protein [Paludibacteraceae bacterium]
MSEVFKTLEETFNVDETEDFVKKTAERIEEIRSEVCDTETEGHTLEDKEYIKFELQNLIASNKNILQMFENQILAGAPPSFALSYVKISQLITENLSKLHELNKSVIDIDMNDIRLAQRDREIDLKEELVNRKVAQIGVDGNGGTTNIQQNNLYLTSEQMTKKLQELNAPKVNYEMPKFDLS